MAHDGDANPIPDEEIGDIIGIPLHIDGDEQDNEDAQQPPQACSDFSSNFRCDGVSSLVALAFELKVPIFHGGLFGTDSGFPIRIGTGASAIVGVSRFVSDMTPDETWNTELARVTARRLAGEKVVVKRFVTGDAGPQSLSAQKIGQELRILAHPYLRRNANIVDVIGLDWEGLPFDTWERQYRCPLLLLEYADCGTLQDFFSLDGIDYTWEIKIDLLYGIANGLEALDDAGVCHGDLKPANVLVFRTGQNSFTTKVCDFASAVVGVDFGQDEEFARLNTFTPPWEAPESADEILIDLLDRVDMYSFGLLACYVALDGQSLFVTGVAGYPLPADMLARQSAIKEWKRQDKLLDVCKAAVRDAARDRYTSTQESVFLELLDHTVRANPLDRTEEYSDLKALLKPNESAQHDQKHDWSPENSAELAGFFQNSLINRYFDGELERSIPDIEPCWQRILPKSIIAAQIFEDIELISSRLCESSVEPSSVVRAAQATYALSLCLIQGFGCEADPGRAGELLIRSVQAGCETAQRYVYRLLGGLGIQLPETLRGFVVEQAETAVTMFGDMQQAHDLFQISPELHEKVMEQRKMNSGLGIHYFGPEVWACCEPDATEEFLEMINNSNSEIDDEYLCGTGLTWLHYAASRGSPELVRAVVCVPGCDVNCVTDDGGYTPLFIACQAGHAQVALLLLDHGADPTIRSQQGSTCLHQLYNFDAAVAGVVAESLVSRGLPIDAKDAHEQTPLATVCSALSGCDSSPPMLKALVDLGADPLARTDDGYTCVDLVAMYLDAGALGALLQSPLMVGEKANAARIQALRVMMSKPLFHRYRSAGWLYQTRLRDVFAALAPPEVLTAYQSISPNHTPLYDACSWAASDITPLLLEAGCDTESFNGRSPLLASIKGNQADVVKTLLAREADISAVINENGWNLLHHAAFYFPAILPSLLSEMQRRGCDILNLVNAGCALRRFTPFDVAVQAENFDAADVLLKWGAQYAEFTRLLNVGDSSNYPLFSSLHHASTSRRRLAYLLGLDTPPRLVVSNSGLTIFHLTAADFEIEQSDCDPSPAKNIGFLLDNYAKKEDAGKGDDFGATPLHYAVTTLNVAVAVALIEQAGVDVNPKARDGSTPLDQLDMYLPAGLERLREHPHMVIVASKLTAKDDMGRYLRDRRLRTMRELLEKHGAVRGKPSS